MLKKLKKVRIKIENCNYADFLINTLSEWTEQLALTQFSDYGVKASDLKTIVEQTSNRNNLIKLTREELLSSHHELHTPVPMKMYFQVS